MFYQNNNDYMRDAFYYSQPQNSTYQYNNGMNSCSPMTMGQNNMYANNGFNNMQTQSNPFFSNMNGMNMNSVQPVSNFYPQIYRVIDPVASRVISNSNYPYYTEDNINNMVDTVYNIVEGDISSLTNTEFSNTSDDTVTQGPSRGASASTSTSTTRQTGNTETTRTTTVTASTQSTRTDNQILKDLIKIIIIMRLLERQNCMRGMQNTFLNNMNQNCYENRPFMNF